MAERYVLVVEDNPDDALMYRHVIELLMHHHATHAGDGITALQLAKEYHYDLVMLDANLPNRVGYPASLRQMEQYKETPITPSPRSTRCGPAADLRRAATCT
jgi:CheY-like chemotaxis protein